ncbi:adenylate cyclase 1 [Abditibacteriota bacterium]|nr:adenylate cyclase 1 [Abditibacteriota bacterium]
MKATPSSRWRLYVLGAIGATLISLLSWHMGLRWGELLDNAAHDVGFTFIRSPISASAVGKLPRAERIVIVDLPHEIPRPLLADLVTQLSQARAVALDLMLVDRASQLSKDERPLFAAKGYLAQWKREDKQLADAIKKAHNVVVGSWPELAPNGTAIRWEPPAPVFERGARATAHLKVIPDQYDGFIRRLRLWENDTPGKTKSAPKPPLPALSLQVAALATGKTAQQLAPPTNEREMWINYLGPRTAFQSQRVLFERALNLASPEDFKDKLVFVGQTDFRSKDVFTTPYDDMPGLLIHANATATLLDERGIPQPLPFWLVALLTLGSALLLVVPLTRGTFLFCAVVAVVEILVICLLVATLWAKWNIVAPLSVPALAVFLTYNGVALYEYARTRRIFGNVVGRAMLSRLLEARAEPTLGGKEAVATAFFCDLRGFSAWSQTRTPQQLITDLNNYTATVVRTVESFGGRTIDFFGDGVFILFEGKEHARHSVEAAIAVSKALERELPPQLRAGVALHTGTMVIGLVGHAHHFKPGAVGEAVNIAARVQSLSDDCGFSVLMTRQTLEAWRHDIHFSDSDQLAQPVFCGARPIKGYASALEVFGVRPLTSVMQPKTLVEV